MSEIKKIPTSKFPGFVYNPALNALRDKPMFEEKLARANETLNRIGLPSEELLKEISAKQKKSKNSQKELPAFLYKVDVESHVTTSDIEDKVQPNRKTQPIVNMPKKEQLNKIVKTATKHKSASKKIAI
jgi:pantoate kinase